MEIFQSTLHQLLMMFTLMLAGYLLCKLRLLPDNVATVLSKLETYLFVPCLSLISMMNQCTVERIRQYAPLMLCCFVICIVMLAVSAVLCRLFVKADGDPQRAYRQRIYRYALTIANHGYVGNFLVLEIWGEVALFQYLLFSFPLGLLSSTWGLIQLIPRDESSRGWRAIKKGLFSPPMIAFFAGIFLGLFNLGRFIPSFLISAMDSASDCMGPIAMILAGIVIGSYKLPALLKNKKTYVCVFLRLVALPTIAVFTAYLLGAGDWGIIFALAAFAVPIGMNTIIYPASYGGETETGASMVLISSVFAVVTLPLLFWLFQNLF